MKSRCTYENRHGSEIQIIKTGDVDFAMHNVPMDFMRTSRNEYNEVIMFDPPGGPYIAAEFGDQPGFDMGWFDPEWKHLVIEKIDLDLEKESARLKCKYTKPIEWEKVK